MTCSFFLFIPRVLSAICSVSTVYPRLSLGAYHWCTKLQVISCTIIFLSSDARAASFSFEEGSAPVPDTLWSIVTSILYILCAFQTISQEHNTACEGVFVATFFFQITSQSLGYRARSPIHSLRRGLVILLQTSKTLCVSWWQLTFKDSQPSGIDYITQTSASASSCQQQWICQRIIFSL